MRGAGRGSYDEGRLDEACDGGNCAVSVLVAGAARGTVRKGDSRCKCGRLVQCTDRRCRGRRGKSQVPSTEQSPVWLGRVSLPLRPLGTHSTSRIPRLPLLQRLTARVHLPRPSGGSNRRASAVANLSPGSLRRPPSVRQRGTGTSRCMRRVTRGVRRDGARTARSESEDALGARHLVRAVRLDRFPDRKRERLERRLGPEGIATTASVGSSTSGTRRGSREHEAHLWWSFSPRRTST